MDIFRYSTNLFPVLELSKGAKNSRVSSLSHSPRVCLNGGGGEPLGAERTRDPGPGRLLRAARGVPLYIRPDVEGSLSVHIIVI